MRTNRWTGVYAWAAAVAALSLAPLGEGPELAGFPWDKLAHGLMYCLLALVLARALAGSRIKFICLTVFILAALFGAVMEWIQYYLPYRSFELKDMLSNILGCLAGCMIYRARARRSG